MVSTCPTAAPFNALCQLKIGTGTPVGDPIEASAIQSAFGSYRSKYDPLWVGAIKSNVGHLEGAAGIAGLIKAVLVLEKGIIPRNIGFQIVNPRIPLQDWNLEVRYCIKIREGSADERIVPS
jgi:acyl transferase domain-containing protein